MNKKLILSGLLCCSGVFLQAQALYNKGTLYVGGSASVRPSLYIKGNLRVVDGGFISHVGKTVLTGDFINDVTTGNVFSSDAAKRKGVFEFRGTAAQKIFGNDQSTARKGTNYIHFPDTILINNGATAAQNTTVTLSPFMGASAKYILFTRGRLVLDSKADASLRRTDIAHLLVDPTGAITYKHNQTNAVDEGLVQVNLSTGDNRTIGALAGFSPPFRNLYADYFFFNFLAEPDKTGFFNGIKDKWIKAPDTALPAGHGYVLGQGIVPWENASYPAASYYAETRDIKYSGARFQDAVRDTFMFARKFASPSFRQYVSTSTPTKTDSITGEELNISNVTVSVGGEFSFLGNPFTAPLDLTELLGATPSTATWGPAVANPGSAFYQRFYILNSGTGSYLANKEFSFTSTYLLAQTVGGTGDMPAPYVIAPMQMFAIERSSSAGTANFIIPASKRTHAATRFLRSDEAPVTDELLIETKDGITGAFDRLCVVFRSNASLQASDPYDATKLFNRTGGVNQIYTRSSENKELITNVVPPSAESLTMYFEPASQAQEVTLTASRLSSITSVPKVVLEDLKTGRAVDLKRAPVYRFVSAPTDRVDRFILHFGTKGPTGTDDVAAPNFIASYASGVIWLHGLRDSQIGSQALVYDISGRLLHQQPVTEAPSFSIDKPLVEGIYIVKIAGQSVSVAKFPVR